MRNAIVAAGVAAAGIAAHFGGSSAPGPTGPTPAESPAEAAKLRENTLPAMLASEAVALR